ncbi:hypothetical protein J6590_072325 [Homalodisca vitripennis]|nr:hypothetical protein J6590_072325 [Homalodisca vitripennis]
MVVEWTIGLNHGRINKESIKYQVSSIKYPCVPFVAFWTSKGLLTTQAHRQLSMQSRDVVMMVKYVTGIRALLADRLVIPLLWERASVQGRPSVEPSYGWSACVFEQKRRLRRGVWRRRCNSCA